MPAKIWQILSLFGLTLLLPTSLSSQPTSLYLINGCAYTNVQTEKDLVVHDASDEAERIVKEIMEMLGLSENFVLKSSGVKNAIATSVDGQRFILYSTTFLEKFKSDANTRWAAYSVLAHQIGHHLNNHNFGETVLRKRKMCELEADRFSGSILRMLNATLEEAQAGIDSIELEGEIATHPSKALRREAVAKGWKKKDEQLRSISGVNRFADSDGDNVADSRDACPDIYGTHASGCPDSDEDGIPDKDDDCDFETGTVANRGCPIPADRDADGLSDSGDQCPDKKGEKRYAGCPDTDGDGVPDHKDMCLNEKGLAGKDGCPEVAATQLSESFVPKESGSESSNPPEPPEPFRNRKSGLEMVAVEGGIFTMGSPATELSRDIDECQHRVTLGSFNIGKYEITQADWQEVMSKNPSSFNIEKCSECPVEQVSWEEVQEFLKKLNARYPGCNYRLPSEEEWEYAARGGKKTKEYIYAGDNLVGNVAWHYGNSGNKTHPVGERKANELGLYDMSGNVWEWCADTHKPYAGCSGSASTVRVLRGGSWYHYPEFCRVAYRYWYFPYNRYRDIGFRVVRGY